MSERAVKIHSEVKKLIATVKELNNRLAQSVPKSEYDALKARSKAEIERLSRELEDLRQSNAALRGLAERLGELEMVEARRALELNRAIEEIGRQVKEQGERIGLILEKADACLNSLQLPLNAVELQSKIIEQQERMAQMVPREEAEALRARVAELEERIGRMRPAQELEELESRLLEEAKGLQRRIQELEARLSASVPKSEYDALERRVKELEAEMAQYIPREEHEAEVAKLKSEIASKEEEAKGLQRRIQELEAEMALMIPKGEAEARIQELEAEIQELRGAIGMLELKVETDGERGEGPRPEEQPCFRFDGSDRLCKELREFYEELRRAPADVVLKHLKEGEIERWMVKRQDEQLASQVLQLRISELSAEEAKDRLMEVVRQKVEEIEQAPSSTGGAMASSYDARAYQGSGQGHREGSEEGSAPSYYCY